MADEQKVMIQCPYCRPLTFAKGQQAERVFVHWHHPQCPELARDKAVATPPTAEALKKRKKK